MILLCISIQKDTVNSTCIVMKCKNLPKKIFNQSKSPINFFCFLKAINLSLTYLSVVLSAYVITCSLCFSTGNLVHGGVGGRLSWPWWCSSQIKIIGHTKGCQSGRGWRPFWPLKKTLLNGMWNNSWRELNHQNSMKKFLSISNLFACDPKDTSSAERLGVCPELTKWDQSLICPHNGDDGYPHSFHMGVCSRPWGSWGIRSHMYFWKDHQNFEQTLI